MVHWMRHPGLGGSRADRDRRRVDPGCTRRHRRSRPDRRRHQRDRTDRRIHRCRRRDGTGLAGRAAGALGCVAVVTGIVAPGVGQAVVCLLDAQVLPGFGVGREREAGIAQQRVGDELRGHLPAFRVPLAPAGMVFERARHHHARHRGLDDVRVGLRDPAGRIADLLSVACERLACGVGAKREPQHEISEEGLLAQELGHAVTDPECGFAEHAGGHHATSRAGSDGDEK